MSDTFGAPEVRQITPGLFPPGTGATPQVGAAGVAPLGAMVSGAGSVASMVNPITGFLLQVSQMLGINPIQLATSIVRDPEGTAAGLDAAGTPGPESAGAAPGDGVGEALMGSEPIDYAYDPTAGIGVGVQPGLSAPSVGAPLPQDAPAPGTGTDTGVVPAANAPPAQGTPIGALLSGVVPPDAPTPPQIGGGGAPSPNPIRPTGMDEIIRAALAVSQPQSQGLTLQQALRRS